VAEQTCRKDPRVVDDQELVAAQQIGEVAERTVLEVAGAAFQEQQARGAAVREGTLGNALRRKRVVEFFKTHQE
jgi:hypothetical protein